jgi:hypothetical protein
MAKMDPNLKSLITHELTEATTILRRVVEDKV